MQSIDFEQVFLNAATEVLETMFFVDVLPEGGPEDGASMLSAELQFQGRVSGRFGVRVPLPGGRVMAANFLGSEQASEVQAGQVLCELANMLCGSVLSRIEEEARFELGHPELETANTDWRAYESGIGYTFGTEQGSLTMWMIFGEPALLSLGRNREEKTEGRTTQKSEGCPELDGECWARKT
jgi:hypothetical protein